MKGSIRRKCSEPSVSDLKRLYAGNEDEDTETGRTTSDAWILASQACFLPI